MGHMIPKLFEVADITVQVQGPAMEIEPLKEILPDADFYEAISGFCLLYTSPSPRDISGSRMPSSA